MSQNSSDVNEINISLGKLNKKMSKKSNCQIPLDVLGFRSKVFYDSTYQYVPRKRYNKHSKYENQKRQQNFRYKLSCIIDMSHATHQQIGDMNFNKRAEWKKIKYILFRTKQQLSCCICLSKDFVAPQMTFCGHVFCWHCILMHYQKSLKATSCPVCNQIFEIQQLKTCSTLLLPPITHGDKIKLKLKTRVLGQKATFDPSTLQQQINLSHIIRMRNSNVLEKYKLQHQEIINQMKKNQDAQTQKYLEKVLQRSQRKIEELEKQINEDKNKHFKIHRYESIVNGIVYRGLSQQQISSQKLMTFYQDQQGRYVFLHPICQKYLVKNFQSQYLPLKIESQVLMKQETEYSNQNLKKYRYLSHLPQNQDFDFVFIRMNELIDYRLLMQFEKQFETYKKKRQEQAEKQQLYAKKLNQKYEREKEYLRQLKKMEQSQFYDIRVPTNMIDLNQIQDSNVFPSLVQNSPKTEEQQKSELNKKQQPLSPISTNKQKKKKQKNFKIIEQDFPGLLITVKSQTQQVRRKDSSGQTNNMKRIHSQSLNLNQSSSKIQNQIQKEQTISKQSSSKQNENQVFEGQILYKKQSSKMQQQSVNSRYKGKKKKKQKFIDVTHQFFQRNQESQY